MKYLGVSLILIFVYSVHLVRPFPADPFYWVEKYLQEYKNGISDLKHFSQTHTRCSVCDNHYEGNETQAKWDAEEYDFIVIGSGAGGSVVASRLSEVPEWKVLLLEAGEAETEVTQIPRYGDLVKNTHYNWGYHTQPQKTWCLGMEDHQCVVETGRAIGGSTAINGLLYTRGNRHDYDLWSDLGNDGWCYDEVLEYFKKIEDAHIEHFDHKYHSRGGHLHIENPQYIPPLAHHFIEAANKAGIETVDYNGKEQLGVSIPQITTKNGKRYSAAQAYLEHAYERKNLVVKPSSMVTQIIITPHTKHVTGVKYVHNGKLYIAKASKEVILSAGAINTPKLLMLSGIGPKEDLEHLNITVLKDLPVGKGLKDHAGFLGLNFIYNETKHEEHDLKEELVKYLKEGKGPLTTNGLITIGYLKTEKAKQHDLRPDVEFVVSDGISNLGADKVKVSRITEETYNSLWKPTEGHKGFSVIVFATHPKSYGIVKLAAKDPFHPPLLDSNLFSDPDDHDIATTVAGIHKVLHIAEQEPLQKLGIHLNTHPVHGCEGYKPLSDDYWKCAIRHVSVSLRHLGGTAKMGPDDDKHAVVDNKLRVHGVHGLRVADASVIPVSLAGHYMAATYLIGEKASDLIKAEWK